MKLDLTNEMQQFFKRCLRNFQSEKINDYVGLKISPRSEPKILKELTALGSHQDSLYLSCADYLASPFQKTITLDHIKDDVFTFRKEKISAHYLFNYDSVQFDPNRELKDNLILKALDQDYEALTLRQNNEVWMMDAPSEAQTINPCAHKAKGRVLTFGLGIGYFPFMALQNPNVEAVTIIEQSSEVIRMFKQHILPQFEKAEAIKIIQGDAYDYFNKTTLKDYDYVFVDIYQSSTDGYQAISKMLHQYFPPLDQVDFWIEDSCFEFMPALILLYFINLSGYQTIKITADYQKDYRKIKRYFESLNKTLSSIDELKFAMYDRSVLRSIAAL